MTHPKEQDLALFATRDLGFVQNFLLNRHVRNCADCTQSVAEYQDLTAALSEPDLDIANWDSLAAEMKANVRLGLEAGACIDKTRTRFARRPQTRHRFNPRLAVAAASLMVLATAGILLRQPKPAPPAPRTVIASEQSIKVDTEGVTITNVYLE